MKVQGIVSKLTKHADTLGLIVGAGAYGFDNLLNNVQLLFTQGHFPDLQQMISELFVGDMGDKMKSGIMLYIGGYIAKDLGFSQGNALMKGSEGYLKGLIAQHALFWSTHSPKGVHREQLDTRSRGSSVSPSFSNGVLG